MERADTITSKRGALRAFGASASGRVIAVALAVAVSMRVAVGEWSWSDGVVVAATMLAVGVVEWVIHLFLLHAPEDAWTSRRLGTGRGHRQHHIDPPALDWLLLRGGDAAVFAVLIAFATAAWTMPLAALAGRPVVATWLTGVLVAYLSLGHYEWTHLLVHTRYRPRTRYYARLARNHRLHHYRNERYWLGVTSNLGDRLLGSSPTDKGDVPLSSTARAFAEPSSRSDDF